jgi:hypothetical protein
MFHGHILLLFQVVTLLTIYSDKYPYKITISYPYNLHFYVHPPFSLSLSFSFYLIVTFQIDQLQLFSSNKHPNFSNDFHSFFSQSCNVN